MSRIGWLRPGDVANDTDSDGDEDMDATDTLTVDESPLFYAPQITLDEYEKQKRDNTKAAVDKLINSPEYQTRLNTCGSCWSCWLENNWCATCMECGGFALTRECPICKGLCKTIWKRDVEMSHSNHEAFWTGECRLPEEQRTQHLLRMVLDEEADPETVLESMQDLSTT